MPELSSAGDDLISAVADGGRSVLLARRASDDDDYDAVHARERAAAAAAFGEPAPIAELNGDAEESDAFLRRGRHARCCSRATAICTSRERARSGAPFGAPASS